MNTSNGYQYHHCWDCSKKNMDLVATQQLTQCGEYEQGRVEDGGIRVGCVGEHGHLADKLSVSCCLL
jgi:hypothetical protein